MKKKSVQKSKPKDYKEKGKLRLAKMRGQTRAKKEAGIKPKVGEVQPSMKTLFSRIKEVLNVKVRDKQTGKYNPRMYRVAETFVNLMETGSFVHVKEFIDREEGKIPTRISDAEGKNLKLYIGMPTDDEPGSP